MASFKPGIGDPLGFDNPYRDGRPNWNLQTKKRVFGPSDSLTGTMQIQEPRPSPYATEFLDKYTRTDRLETTAKGRHHFAHHLAVTTNEFKDRGVGVPDHLVSGWDRPDRAQGRASVAPRKYDDPKDGGVWEPVARQYPKVPKVDRIGGTKIIAREPAHGRDVDIWPCTLTVKDYFKPGGLKMFEGKRATNTAAFPGAIGYEPPKTYDDQGRMMDYSSVKEGGPFGKKMVHDNSPKAVPPENPPVWHTTRMEHTTRKREEERTRTPLQGTQSFYAGGTGEAHRKPKPALIPPRDPSSASARAAMSAMSANMAAHLSATTVGDASLAKDTLHVAHGRRASGGGSLGSRRSSQLSTQQPQQERGASAKTHTPPVFTAMYKPHHEHPLTAATPWTFMGGFRP